MKKFLLLVLYFPIQCILSAWYVQNTEEWFMATLRDGRVLQVLGVPFAFLVPLIVIWFSSLFVLYIWPPRVVEPTLQEYAKTALVVITVLFGVRVKDWWTLTMSVYGVPCFLYVASRD